ncbi:hypothetical protein [Streptomyces sp. NPDC030920]|uniref:hypothetical protein n=1 Tax=Streptomyces sp. NPDC030920 TaxID=3365308 RepID=UPI00384DCE93
MYVVESRELGADIVGRACSAELVKQAADAVEREAAMAAASGCVLRRRGYVTSVRADVPGSHQLIVRVDEDVIS